MNTLIAQQKTDDSLLEARKNAESGRDGYEEGVLTHQTSRAWERMD